MTAVATFLEQAGWADATLSPIASDASDRRYQRVLGRNGSSAVLMQAPVAVSPEAAQQFSAFRKVSKWLYDVGLSAPVELAADPDAGFLLLEDLGQTALSHLLTDRPAEAEVAYHVAAETIAQLATADAPTWMDRPDAAHLAKMVDLTLAQANAPKDMARRLRTELAEMLDASVSITSVSLRDVHADNLIWRGDEVGVGRIGLLDFQDALILPDGYDLASLVDDPRRVVPQSWRQTLIAAYADRRGMNRQAMHERVDLLSLQRNLRILGIFRRLAAERGRPHYLEFLPRTRALISRCVGQPHLQRLQPAVHELLDLTAHWQAQAA